MIVPVQEVQYRHQRLFQALAAAGEQGDQHRFFHSHDILWWGFLQVGDRAKIEAGIKELGLGALRLLTAEGKPL